ncbi:HlyD family secretion protein [Pseudomonas beijingensis]|uniref:HlyD family secretion protein n=1 Tax=Pseudomonas beijingensis TaxID=2954101 RepID=A0ABY9FJ02_9PSED|nr:MULTISPECIES: HlyD family secretion protein [unclassified Pseudomonas]WLH03439.1 HlyD family secretion protein [Pseudomonas sp. FP2034]WLI43192.1 HlyD family secretion protein [Pseudomonas sp. FP830]
MPETQNSPVSVEPERQTEPPPEKPAPANPLRRIALGAAVLIAVLFTLSIIMERRTPSTSQAVVQAYVVEMAAEVGGRVTEIAVLDNARVKAGQVLFRIDPQPYKLVVSEAEARLEETGQTLGASTASVDAAQAQLVSARAQRDNIREQARRVNQLVERGVFAPARQDEAKASLSSAEAAVSKAQADLERSRQQLGPKGNDNPQFKQALAALEKARLDLVRTEVIAPADGVITHLQLAVGQVVSAGQPALTFIDRTTVWVSAAFKENSLEHVQADDPAELVFDVLPGRVFKGRVESVGWGVAQQDSSNAALPSVRNESGWVRDPQRFPVRLIVEEPHPIGPRYGSQVTVVIYTDDNPMTNALGAFMTRLGAWLNYVN